jgi:DNA-binding transcriptional ArsR family regulator
MRSVRVIDDVATLKAMADPTRAALLELLIEPRSVTQLAETLDVPRTRLYHHIDLLVAKGLVEQVDERRVGAMTERIYALTARTFRASARLLRSGDVAERAEAVTTLMFDTTKSDLRRSLERETQAPRLGIGRSIAYLRPDQAEKFIAKVEALVERFDDAHASGEGREPFALVWALYPTSHRVD